MQQASVNKVIIVGTVIKLDPAQLPSGATIMNIFVDTAENYVMKTGEKRTSIEHHKLSAFGKLAERLKSDIRVGDLVFSEGKIKTRSWEGPDKKRKFSTEIECSNIEILDGEQDAPAQAKMQDKQINNGNSLDDDFPIF